jgi:hypothetical protein
LLISESRFSDAVTVADTAAKMPEMKGSAGAQMRDLMKSLEALQKRQKLK